MKDIEGNTPLLVACQYGHPDVVQLLLEHSQILNTNIPEDIDLDKEIKDLISSGASGRAKRRRKASNFT